VFVNEQTCNGNNLVINAIHIIVPGVLEVIAAHSLSGASGCACATC
jgi:hypothetical protein